MNMKIIILFDDNLYATFTDPQEAIKCIEFHSTKFPSVPSTIVVEFNEDGIVIIKEETPDDR